MVRSLSASLFVTLAFAVVWPRWCTSAAMVWGGGLLLSASPMAWPKIFGLNEAGDAAAVAIDRLRRWHCGFINAGMAALVLVLIIGDRRGFW